jgi:hypothetical protein
MDERPLDDGLPMKGFCNPQPREKRMRSELVHAALHHEPNRYALCHLLAKGMRALHRPNTRLQNTMNEALQLLTQEQPQTKSRIVEMPSAQRRRAA